MTDTFYAGSYIKLGSGNPSTGEAPNLIPPGDPVTRDDLKCTDEEWNDYIRDGVVRTEKLPEDMRPDETLFRYRVRHTMEAHEAALSQAIAGSPPPGVTPVDPQSPQAKADKVK